MRIGANFFPKLHFFLEFSASLGNLFLGGGKYTPKDFLGLLTLMNSSIKILSYNMTYNELEHVFTYNWEVSHPINRLERIRISEFSQQFHLSL